MAYQIALDIHQLTKAFPKRRKILSNGSNKTIFTKRTCKLGWSMEKKALRKGLY